jgi:hypothetical protein
MALSRIKKIDLREQWKHEASDFSNWLAKDENLQLLSDEIGIDISLVETEARVGNFVVDIRAEEETTGRKIVIENQLETTNHDHLGKIITYASGIDAEIIIWIVRDVRDEHKRAVDWLNEHTDEKINIFAIKMELWQIADSPYAPNFKIVSQPNDWAKAIKKAAMSSTLSDTKLMQLEFWTQFNEYAENNQTALRLRKAQPQHWYDISIGSSKAYLSLIIDTKNNQIRCEFYIPNSEEIYQGLFLQKDAISSKLEYDLEWMELPGKKASRIRTVFDTEVNENNNWEDCFAWLTKTAEDFQSVFAVYLKKLLS